MDSGWVFLRSILRQIKGTVRLVLRLSEVLLRSFLSTASSETHHNAGQITHSGYTTHHLNVQHGGLRRPVCHTSDGTSRLWWLGKNSVPPESSDLHVNIILWSILIFLFVPLSIIEDISFIKTKQWCKREKQSLMNLVEYELLVVYGLEQLYSYTLELYSSCSPTLYPTPWFLSCCAPDLRRKRGRRLFKKNI